jgi:hypothetical protein
MASNAGVAVMGEDLRNGQAIEAGGERIGRIESSDEQVTIRVRA